MDSDYSDLQFNKQIYGWFISPLLIFYLSECTCCCRAVPAEEVFSSRYIRPLAQTDKCENVFYPPQVSGRISKHVAGFFTSKQMESLNVC